MESSTSLRHPTAKSRGTLDNLKVHAFQMHGHERCRGGQARGPRWRRWALSYPFKGRRLRDWEAEVLRLGSFAFP